MYRTAWQAELADSGLGKAAVCLGYRLSEYGDPDGTNIFPSLVGLAKRLGYRNPGASGRRCVQRLLRRLVDAGWLIVEHGTGRKGRGGRTNRYRLSSPVADLSQVDCVMCALEGAESCGCTAVPDRLEGAVKRPPDPPIVDPELGDLGPESDDEPEGGGSDDEFTDDEHASMLAIFLLRAVGADIGDWETLRKVTKRFSLVPRADRERVWHKCLGPLPDSYDTVAGLLLHRIGKHDKAHWHQRVSIWYRAGQAFAKVRR